MVEGWLRLFRLKICSKIKSYEERGIHFFALTMCIICWVFVSALIPYQNKSVSNLSNEEYIRTFRKIQFSSLWIVI